MWTNRLKNVIKFKYHLQWCNRKGKKWNGRSWNLAFIGAKVSFEANIKERFDGRKSTVPRKSSCIVLFWFLLHRIASKARIATNLHFLNLFLLFGSNTWVFSPNFSSYELSGKPRQGFSSKIGCYWWFQNDYLFIHSWFGPSK